MSFEDFQESPPSESAPNAVPEASLAAEEPTALAERVPKMVRTLFRIETTGLQNLDDIPAAKHCIFLTTHLSDYDVPLAIAALAEKFPKLKVAESSTHERFAENPGGYLGRKIGGEENSFSVDFSGGRGGGSASFNPENFEKMRATLEEGNTLVIAAYFDTKYQNKTWRLPKKGGTGGVYLGQITPDAVVVPVAVDIRSKKAFGMGEPSIGQIIKEMRPRVEVKIGTPIVPEPIPAVGRFSEILDKRKRGEELTSEDRAEFSRIRKALRADSDKVMASLGEMLPPEKRPLELDERVDD